MNGNAGWNIIATVIHRLAVILVVALAAAPAAVLVVTGLAGASPALWDEIFYRPFWAALGRSFRQMAWSGAVAFAIGWPYGTALGLFRFPLKRACFFMLAVPLLVPPFLWAIGLQSLKPFFSYRNQLWVDGFMGTVLAYATLLIPLVSLVAAVAATQITRSESEVAAMHGGRMASFRLALRHGLPAAAGATLFGSILTLSDSGVGQIMGYHGASGEILVAFSAKNDFGLAALKAVVILAVVLPLLAISVGLLVRGLGAGANARSLVRSEFDPGGGWPGRWMTGVMMVVASGVLLLPAFYGLLRPLVDPPREPFLQGAFDVFRESLPTTLKYGLAAGGIATGMGLFAALQAGRTRGLLAAMLLASVVLMAVPSSLHALGMVKCAAVAPPVFDWLFRSEWSVGLAGGLRLFPLAAMILAVSWHRVPGSLEEVARVHGVGRLRFLLKLVVPVLGGAILGVFLLAGLLSLADVTSTVLLQPPGSSSYGARLFAVMDNSAEKVVSALCLVYLLIPLGFLLGSGTLTLGRFHKKTSFPPK